MVAKNGGGGGGGGDFSGGETWYKMCIFQCFHDNHEQIFFLKTVSSLLKLANHTMYKWKKHFSEMKGDVGMSLHEKEGEQEHAYTETGSH